MQKIALPAVALAGLFGMLYAPVVHELWQVWWADPNYAHGFLVPLVVGYWVWRRRAGFAKRMPAPSWWGVPVLVAALFFRFAGTAVETVGAGTGGLFVKGFSLVAASAGLVLLLWGPRMLKQAALPLGYLLFMVPLPGGLFVRLTLPLQEYVTQVATAALRLMQIPVLQEGNVIALPALALGVVEACSGIRSLFSLLALAGAIVLFFSRDQSPWRSAALVASAVPIAIAANAFRVTATGLLAHLWGGEIARGFYHGFSGWLVFVAAFALLSAETCLFFRVEGPEQERPA